jgi:hypothetical protein
VTPYKSRVAKKNLREGIKKMEKTMSPAAQVRRDFRLGRPPRPIGENERPQPLHRTVAWQRAVDALASFRVRMTGANLNPGHVAAAIIFIEGTNQDQPHFLFVEEKGKTSEEMQKTAFEQLGRDDVIALGMVFVQVDEQTKQRSIFPYQFFGLNQRGIAVLRRAVELEFAAGEMLKNVN